MKTSLFLENIKKAIKYPSVIILLIISFGILTGYFLNYLLISPIVLLLGIPILTYLALCIYFLAKGLREASDFCNKNVLNEKERCLFKRQKRVFTKYFITAVLISVGGMLIILFINLGNFSFFGMVLGYVICMILGQLIMRKGVQKTRLIN